MSSRGHRHVSRRTVRPRASERAGRAPRPAGTPAPKVQPDRTGPVHVEIVIVGRELLQGAIRDANGPLLGKHFSSRGALVHRVTLVDETESAVSRAVREALERQPHLVVTTGGLGPARSDVTAAGVAAALQRPLRPDARAREMIEQAYRRLRSSGGRGRPDRAGMTQAREKPCSLPVGGEPLPNPRGVSPGMWIRLTGRAAVLCLPGTPAEARAVLETAAPLLKDVVPQHHRAVREVETPTADEASLRPLLDRLAEEYPMVWVRSRGPDPEQGNAGAVVTLEASSPDRAEAESAVDGAVQRLLALAAGVR